MQRERERDTRVMSKKVFNSTGGGDSEKRERVSRLIMAIMMNVRVTLKLNIKAACMCTYECGKE